MSKMQDVQDYNCYSQIYIWTCEQYLSLFYIKLMQEHTYNTQWCIKMKQKAGNEVFDTQSCVITPHKEPITIPVNVLQTIYIPVTLV